MIFRGNYKNTPVVIYAQAETETDVLATDLPQNQDLNNLNQLYLEPPLDLLNASIKDAGQECLDQIKESLKQETLVTVPQAFRFDQIYQEYLFTSNELLLTQNKLVPELLQTAVFSNISPSLLLVTNEELLKEEDNPQLLADKMEELGNWLKNMTQQPSELLKNEQMMFYFSTFSESVSKIAEFLNKSESRASLPFFFETNLHKNEKISLDFCEVVKKSIEGQTGSENEQILVFSLLSNLVNSKIHVDKICNVDFVVNFLAPVFKEPAAGVKLANLFFENFYWLTFNKQFRNVTSSKHNESIFLKAFNPKIHFSKKREQEISSDNLSEISRLSKTRENKRKTVRETSDSESNRNQPHKKDHKDLKKRSSKNQALEFDEQKTIPKDTKIKSSEQTQLKNIPHLKTPNKFPENSACESDWLFELNIKHMLLSQSKYFLHKFTEQHELFAFIRYTGFFTQNVKRLHHVSSLQVSVLHIFEDNYWNLKQFLRLLKLLTRKNSESQSFQAKIHDELKNSTRQIYQNQTDIFTLISNAAKNKEKSISCALAAFLKEENLLDFLVIYLSNTSLLNSDFYEMTFQLCCRLFFYIVRCQGGVALLLSHKQFSHSFVKLLKTLYDSDPLISKITSPAVFNCVFQKDVYVYSKYIDPSKFIKEALLDKDYPAKSRISVMAGQYYYFFLNLNSAVTLMDNLSSCLLSWDNHHELLINLTKIDEMFHMSCLSKQSMSLVLKETHLFNILILILKVENVESYQKMRFEISIVCKILYQFLKEQNFKVPFTHFQNLKEVLQTLDMIIIENNQLNPLHDSEPHNNDLFLNLWNLKSIIFPFEKIKEDFSTFVSNFQASSRYTHTNITTLLTNKQHFSNVEREFPKLDPKKYFARLSDYLAFFKISSKTDNKISETISYLKIIRFALQANSSLNQVFVSANIFDMVNFLALVSENILSAFIGNSQLSRNIQNVYKDSKNLVTEDFLDLFTLTLKILLKKTAFKEKQDVFGKEYENTDLFFCILNFLSIAKDFKPNYIYELCIERVFELKEYYQMGTNQWKIGYEKHKYMKKFKSFCFSKEVPCFPVFLSKFVKEKIVLLLPTTIKFITLFAKFPGSYDTLLSELLFLIFAKNTNRELYLIITSVFISEPKKWKHREKIKKIIQTLLFDKVRTAKRSKVILIQKYGSTRPDSLFDIHVTQNGFNSSIEFLIHTLIVASDQKIFYSFGLFLMSLIEWKDPLFCSAIFSSINLLFRDSLASLENTLGFSVEVIEDRDLLHKDLKQWIHEHKKINEPVEVDKVAFLVRNLGKLLQMLNLLSLSGIFKLFLIEEDFPADLFTLVDLARIFDCFEHVEVQESYLTLKLEIIKLFKVFMNEEIGFVLKARDFVSEDNYFTEIPRQPVLFQLIDCVNKELDISPTVKSLIRKNTTEPGTAIGQLHLNVFFQTMSLLKLLAKNPITKNICCYSEYSKIIDTHKKPLLDLRTLTSFILRYAEDNTLPTSTDQPISDKLTLNQFSVQHLAVILDYFLQTAFLLITHTLEDCFLLNDFCLSSLTLIFSKKRTLKNNLDRIKIVIQKFHAFKISETVIFKIELLLNSLYSYLVKLEKEKKRFERYDISNEIIDIKSRLVRYHKQFFRFEESIEELSNKRNFLPNFFNFMKLILENKFLRISKQKNFCRETFTKQIQCFLDLKCKIIRQPDF